MAERMKRETEVRCEDVAYSTMKMYGMKRPIVAFRTTLFYNG
jgi:hypothetical protein